MNGSLFKPALIALAVLFAASAQYFVYAAYVAPRAAAAGDLQALSNVLDLENRKKPGYKAPENLGVTIPDLLARVQELAAQNAMAFYSIDPLPQDAEQLKLRLTGRFGNLLQFLARFETLQVAITGYEVLPSETDPSTLLVSIMFRHTAGPSRLRSDAAKQFTEKLRAAAPGDPFDRSAVAVEVAANPDNDDLTWTYHLTSISQIGRNRYATIDGKDYNVGDRLQGLIVREIGQDNVTLLDQTGSERRERFVKFRRVREGRT